MPAPPPTHAPAYSIHLPSTPSTPKTPRSPATIHTNLRLTTTPVPQPPYAPKTTLIHIHAAALNYRDLLVISSSPLYPTRTAHGLIPCSDGAGIVTATGPSSKWKEGDRVLLTPNPSWLQGDDPRDFVFDTVLGGANTHGTLRQYLLARDEDLISAPSHLSLEEAATIPTAGGTAISVLFHGPNSKGGKGIRSGEWVLTQGTGGVSCFAIQLAATAGARVVSTSSSDEKLEVARRLGARAAVNYRESESWGGEVRRLTGGAGVDCVVEVGGAGTIVESLEATRIGGLVNVVGILTESEKADLVPVLLYGAKTARGSLGISRAMVEECVEMIEAHDLHPVVAEVFEWQDAPEAFETLLKQNSIGKIVVKV